MGIRYTHGWRHFLRENARSFRRALLAYRDGARIHAGSRAEPFDREAAEAQLQCLMEAGFPLRDALLALVAVSRYVVGAVLEEQAERVHPPARDAADAHALPRVAAALEAYMALGADEAFDHGLELILDGVAR